MKNGTFFCNKLRIAESAGRFICILLDWNERKTSANRGLHPSVKERKIPEEEDIFRILDDS